MALIGSSIILRSSAICHLTLAYYLFTSPATLAEQNLVVILGAAMDIPLPSESLSTPNSATGFAALLLATFALNDLTSPAADDPVGRIYWGNQAPLRAAFYFFATGGIYFWKFGLEDSKKMEKLAGSAGGMLAMRQAVCNSFVFSFVFLEMLLWFWVRFHLGQVGLGLTLVQIFTVIREERRHSAPDRAVQRRVEE